MDIYIIIILCIIIYLLFVTGKTENFTPLSDCNDEKNRLTDNIKDCNDDKNRLKDNIKDCNDDKNSCNTSLNTRTNERNTCNTTLNTRTGERDSCNTTLNTRTNERNSCNTTLNTRTGERDSCNTSLNDYKGFHEICNSALNMRTDELNTCNTNLNASIRERDTCSNTLNNYTNYFNDFNLLRRKYSDIFPRSNINASQEVMELPITSNIDVSQEAMELPTPIAMYPLQTDFRNIIIASSINITPKIVLSGYVFTNNALLIKSTNIGDVFTFSIGQQYKAISYWLYCDHIKMNETFNNEAPVIKDAYNTILENYIPNKKWICISINIGNNGGDLDVYVTYDGILKKINYLQDRDQKRAISFVIIKISLSSLINNLSVYDRELSENNIRELNVRTPVRTDIIDNY
jgi:hypothetical protein